MFKAQQQQSENNNNSNMNESIVSEIRNSISLSSLLSTASRINSNSNPNGANDDGNEMNDNEIKIDYTNNDISDEKKDLCTFDANKIIAKGSSKIALAGMTMKIRIFYMN